MPTGWRIEVEILFAAFEQKDCNAKPQQTLNKYPTHTAPKQSPDKINYRGFGMFDGRKTTPPFGHPSKGGEFTLRRIYLNIFY